MSVVVVLYGPKAAGKSLVADILGAQYAVVHVDADRIVLDLLAAGQQPDPENGWLTPVECAVHAALAGAPTVSVEATGAWPSDWRLSDGLESAGVRVLRVLVTASLETTLGRLARRDTVGKAPVSPDEARWIHAAVRDLSRDRRFDLVLDTDRVRPADIAAAVAPLAPVLDDPVRGRA